VLLGLWHNSDHLTSRTIRRKKAIAAIASQPKICILTEVRMWELLEYVGETLVFFGVVGEVFAEWREPHRKRLAKASSIVLVIGLALSLASLIETNEYFNSTIADLNLKASQADAKSTANEAEAATQRDRADKDEKDLLTLQHASLPRAIDIKGIRSSMEKFSGMRFAMFALGEYEPDHTADQICDALKDAHWNKFADFRSTGGLASIFEKPGILVEAAPDDLPGRDRTRELARAKAAAQSLVSALNEQGIDAHIRSFASQDAESAGGPGPGGGVSIFVSEKPMPDQSKGVVLSGNGVAPTK
jgi:hypothetical protein